MRCYNYILLIFCLCLTWSCSENVPLVENAPGEISGSGILVTRSHRPGLFDSVHTSGPITTVISQGQLTDVQVTADNNVINQVGMEIKGNTLYLFLKEGQYHNIWVRVEVSLPHIRSITNAGDGSMQVSKSFSNDPLLLINSGGGTIWIEGEGGDLYLQNAGNGTVSGFDFRTTNCYVNNSGGGSCELFCRSSLKGVNTQSGTIRYKGSARVSIDNPAHGTVIAAN